MHVYTCIRTYLCLARAFSMTKNGHYGGYAGMAATMWHCPSYIHIHTYTHIHTHTYITHIHAGMAATVWHRPSYIPTYTCIHTHTNTHTRRHGCNYHTYIHIHSHTYTYMHTYIHIHTHTYINTHTRRHGSNYHTYIHIHSHTYTQAWQQLSGTVLRRSFSGQLHTQRQWTCGASGASCPRWQRSK